MLWDLYGPAAGKLFRSWSTTCKIAHDVPPQCRTYFVENFLSGHLPSLRQLVIKRYIQFVQNLFFSENLVIQQVANLSVLTVRSVTGRNVSNIQMEFQKSPLYSNKQEFSLRRKELSVTELENIELLDNLLSLRSKEIDDEILSELDILILNVCSK